MTLRRREFLKTFGITASAVALTLVALYATAVAAQGTGPIAHARIGNNTEGATLITAGPLAEQVALLDGYDVLAVPVEGRGRTAPQKLFDLKGLVSMFPGSHPSGIVYVPSERAYLFDDNGQPDTLLATDEQGRPLPPRPITYLPGTLGIFEVEGMTYLPRGSRFPDRIARIVVGPSGWDIEVMTRAGVVEREIPLGPPLDFAPFVPGLAYDRFSQAFIVSTDPGEFWKVGSDGAVISGPTAVPGGVVLALEGLAELRDGRVVAADYAAGKLFAFNADLTPDPSGVRLFPIGVGVSRPAYGVFDPLTGRYALSGVVGVGELEGVAEVAPSLDSASTLFGFDGVFEPHGGIAYVPEDDAFALGRVFRPRGIDIFRRDGSLIDSIDIATVAGLPNRPVRRLAYVPTTRQFAVSLSGFPNQVFLVSRARTYDGSFTVAGVPLSLQYVSQAGQDRLLAWAPPALLTYDLAGNLLATQYPPLEGLVHPDVFVAGPGDDFALLDPDNSEAVVFAP